MIHTAASMNKFPHNSVSGRTLEEHDDSGAKRCDACGTGGDAEEVDDDDSNLLELLESFGERTGNP